MQEPNDSPESGKDKDQPKPSGMGAATKKFFTGVMSSLADNLKPQKSIPTEPLHEVLPADVQHQYQELSSNEALKTHLFRDIPNNNAIIPKPIFCRPIDAYLVARCPKLWHEVNPFKSKVVTEAEKDEMTKMASISPFFYLKSLALDKFGVEFDQIVVAAFAGGAIEKYFLNSDRGKLADDYVNFMQESALFLPAMVQGDELCVLMCTNSLPDGSRPIQDAVFSHDDIVDRYVLFHFAMRIERMIDRMQNLQAGLALSPEKSIFKRVANKAKGKDAVFNDEKKLFAKFVGDRLLRMLGVYLSEKTVFRVDEKILEEKLNWASYAEHYIYQLILKLNAALYGEDSLNHLINFFRLEFDKFLFGKADVVDHLLVDFQKKCDTKYQPDLREFREVVNEIAEGFGVNLLLIKTEDLKVLGLQELFKGRKVSQSLGLLLLSNASPEQLVTVANRYPNAGHCFLSNVKEIFLPLIVWVSKHYDNVELAGVRQIVAGCDRQVYLHLEPSHFAALVAINPQACIASIASYLQNVKNEAGLFLRIINNNNLTPEACDLILREFNGNFITAICQRIAKDNDANSGALVKLLLCKQVKEIHDAIKKLLAKSHAKVFELFDFRYCNQEVIQCLEDILLKTLKSEDVDVADNMPKYLLCRKVVESKKDVFLQACRRDHHNVKAVVMAVQEDEAGCVSSVAREWVVPFLCKLILSVDEKTLEAIGFDAIHNLFAVDDSIPKSLLERKAIAQGLEKNNKLTQADWQIMMDMLVNQRGQELLTCDILQNELGARFGLWISAINLHTKPQGINRIFCNEMLGRLVLRRLNHQKRVLLFNFAHGELLTQLIRLFDQDLLRSKLLEVLACCLREINNEAFFEWAFADQGRLAFIIKSAANQPLLQNFINANENKNWVNLLRNFHAFEPDDFLRPTVMPEVVEEEESVAEEIYYEEETEDVTDGARGSAESSPRRPVLSAYPAFSLMTALPRLQDDAEMRIISNKKL